MNTVFYKTNRLLVFPNCNPGTWFALQTRVQALFQQRWSDEVKCHSVTSACRLQLPTNTTVSHLYLELHLITFSHAFYTPNSAQPFVLHTPEYFRVPLSLTYAPRHPFTLPYCAPSDITILSLTTISC